MSDAERSKATALEYDIPREAKAGLILAIQQFLKATEKYFVPPARLDIGDSVSQRVAADHGDLSLAQMPPEAIVSRPDSLSTLDVIDGLCHFGREALAWVGGGSFQHVSKSVVAGFEDRINEILQDHGLGYSIINGRVERLSSPILTDGALRPALNLLASPGFEAADENFHEALNAIKSAKYAEAITWANTAFESTMKIILKERERPAAEGATSKDLIPAVMGIPGLVPPFTANYFTNLSHVLFGLANLRNKGKQTHGAETPKPDTTLEEAEFAVNLAATNVLFLIRRHQNLAR